MNQVSKLQQIGQGRSATVFLEQDTLGGEMVRKIFTGEGVSKLVLFILTGSANPYTWCEAAIRTAITRRNILLPLVRFWFGDKLRVLRSNGWSWNDELKAFEIRAELIKGSHAPLKSPFLKEEPDYITRLIKEVMEPLQKHLADAGFDGLVWQAGLGNPVASNNFMLESLPGEPLKWVWIDLESGVPALFAMNPLATLGFYLPKSFQHGRPLFDDVHLGNLRKYLQANRDAIVAALGLEEFALLTEHTDQLESIQQEWRSLKRHQRSVAYEYSRDRISLGQFKKYQSRPFSWYIFYLSIIIPRMATYLKKGWHRLIKWISSIDLRRIFWNSIRYISSTSYRWQVAQNYVKGKVLQWSKRKYLENPESSHLIRELEEDNASAFITDFSVHLAIKPVIKFLQWAVFPTLWALGLINSVSLSVIIVAGGAIGRTLYTLWRLMQASLHGRRKPWVALIVGVLPVIGNTAYPLQLLYRGTENTGELARFIIYDTLATVGRSVPIWGGMDSRFEHFFVGIGVRVVQLLSALKVNQKILDRSQPSNSS